MEGLFDDGESALLGDTLVTACPWWNGPVSRAGLENLLARESATSVGRWIWSHHESPEGARVSWSGKKPLGDRYLREWISAEGESFRRLSLPDL